MLRLLISLCLLLLYFGVLAMARVILYVPTGERTFRLNDSSLFLDDLFGNGTDLIVWPTFQWPQFTMPNVSYDFLNEISTLVRSIFKILHTQTMAFYNSFNDTITGQRKKPAKPTKPASTSAYNLLWKPFGNFSFSFGFSFNFQSSGNFGHARMNFYEIMSENETRLNL